MIRSFACGGVLCLGCCSAHASAWPEEHGAVRVSAAAVVLSSEGQFAPGDAGGLTGPLCPDPVTAGERMPYSCVTGGTFGVTQVLLDVSGGVLPWLTLDATVPVVVHAFFEDDVGRTEARGLGDVRFGARAGRTWRGWALSGVLRAKAPTGPRNFQDRDVPIGEGQWDLEAGMRGGRSLHPWGWAEVQQALVVRLRNPDTGIDPGEEWVGSVGVGLTAPPVQEVGLQLGGHWILALPDDTAFGITVPGRKLLQARASVFARPVGSLWLQAGVGIPLAGQRWPTGIEALGAVAWTF